jgi:protease II
MAGWRRLLPALRRAPAAARRPGNMAVHGVCIADEYQWMQQDMYEDELRKYLQTENK